PESNVFALSDKEMSPPSVPGYAEFRSGPQGHAYNEAAFRYFLVLDRRRAERARQSLLLVLVTLREARSGKLSPTTATALFSALGDCVRATDFVGWYREGRIVAAVLAQSLTPTIEVRRRTTERIVQSMNKRLMPNQMKLLRIRVICLGRRATS